jgi:hypothetical protein
MEENLWYLRCAGCGKNVKIVLPEGGMGKKLVVTCPCGHENEAIIDPNYRDRNLMVFINNILLEEDGLDVFDDGMETPTPFSRRRGEVKRSRHPRCRRRI